MKKKQSQTPPADNYLNIQQYEKQIFDLKQLFEISKSLNSTLDYNILIDSILLICMAQLKVLKVGLFVRKHLDSAEFSLHRNYTGFEIDRDHFYAIPENHELIHFFSNEYNCYTLEEIREKRISLEGLDTLIKLEPSLLIPLKAKGHINGIIILGERIGDGAFDEYEKEYIVSIAIMASIAINNAFLFEMTTTDMMTKLKMKHYLYTIMLERLEAAKKAKGFSIIMMDLDFFKKVNDTYGHTCGDLVLQHVAQIMLNNIRTADIAARYGGEEFVILVSKPGKKVVLEVAERIRATVEESKILYKDQVITITISCGVACYNKRKDHSPNIMIERADKALYKSKQNGRNRISMAE
ncbi:MAG: sensor domain-containing diguanylate cyclase [Treponema sp.]|jgi:diguanylate cyclase (GGDEF)-like protein|nr:sensor domain-containing diguanylate cyclase [Treponema sp.]